MVVQSQRVLPSARPKPDVWGRQIRRPDGQLTVVTVNSVPFAVAGENDDRSSTGVVRKFKADLQFWGWFP